MNRCESAVGADDIRNELRTFVSGTIHDLTDTVIIDELGICQGQARVDMAVVNGRLHGFEIKSDKDNLRRLLRQIDIYDKVLDEATLVVGERYCNAVVGILPDWWGLVRFDTSDERVTFTEIRKPTSNPKQDPRALVELLWLDETKAFLERKSAMRGLRNRPKRELWDKVCECFELEEIASEVRTILKLRVTPKVAELL